MPPGRTQIVGQHPTTYHKLLKIAETGEHHYCKDPVQARGEIGDVACFGTGPITEGDQVIQGFGVVY